MSRPGGSARLPLRALAAALALSAVAGIPGAAAAFDLPAAPALVTSPMPFVGITPCRVVDTRDPAMPSGYGPPSMEAGLYRDFILPGPCGIPAGAVAVSLNVTIVNPQGIGYVLLYPTNSSQPAVSTLNYDVGQTVANAAIVPLGPLGLRVIAVLSGTDLIIDTNGYYGATTSTLYDTFLGVNAGNVTMQGLPNTGLGYTALSSVGFGGSNEAAGFGALAHITDGNFNVGLGAYSLSFGSSGTSNTAVGAGAMAANTNGYSNVAIGQNTLSSNTTGAFNAAAGDSALSGAPDGGHLVGIGTQAGVNLTGGNSNIYLANPGGGSESVTVRIGSSHTRAFIAGIRGVTTGNPGAIPVLIDSAGQLGTVSSSIRSKDDVRDMGEASGALMRLRPVNFHYRGHPEPSTEFGLIAEEVEEVLPDLVTCGADGEPETVLYHELPAMLLNELQKQDRQLDRDEAEAGERRRSMDRQEDASRTREARIEALRDRIAELEKAQVRARAASAVEEAP